MRVQIRVPSCNEVRSYFSPAVAAAYGWPADISEDDALAKLLELNLSRAGAGQTNTAEDDGAEE